MRRLGRVLALPLGFAVAMWLGTAAAPSATFACTCATELGRPFTDVAEFVGDPQWVIVSGTVAGLQPGRGHSEQFGTFSVERVFQGSVPASQMVVVGGDSAACEIRLEEGMQFIGVATVENNMLDPSWCVPYGDLRFDGGKAILLEVQSRLGEGMTMDEPEPTPEVLAQVVDVPGGFSPFATMAIVAVLGLIAVIVAGVVVAIGRGGRSEPGDSATQ